MGLSRQVAIVAAGRASATLSLFAVNALLARTWSLTDFGRFSAIWILGNTLAPLFLLGIPTALLYAFPRRTTPAARRALVGQASIVLTLSAGALAVLLWFGAGALAPWVADAAGASLAGLVVPFLPYVFSLVAAGHVEAALVAAGRPAWQAGLALGAAAGAVLVAAAARMQGWEVADTLAALSAVGMARLAAGYLVLAAAVGGPRSLPRAELWQGVRGFLGYAAHVGLNDAVGSLSRAVDRVVVLVLLGATDLALYHVGAIEVPVSLALAAVVTVLVPEVSRLSAAGRLDEVARLFRAAVGRLALFILPLFFFLLVHAGAVIAVYLPGAFDRTDEVFRIFLLALPVRCAVYNPVLVGTGRARWALYASLLDLAANAALSVLFVRWLQAEHTGWALLGPAAATVLATWLQVAVLVAALARLLGTPWTRLLPWGRLGAVSGLAALAAGVSAWAAAPAASPAVQLVIGTAVYAPLLVGLLIWLRRQDWLELTDLARGLLRPARAAADHGTDEVSR